MSDFNRSESNARRSDPEDALASILHQAEVWTSAQGALLSQAETVWSDWLHRRREAVVNECVEPARFLGRQVLADVEAFDLTRDLGGEG